MNLDYDFFRIDQKTKPGKGKILVSEPFLNDSYFSRSVVLLTEYSKKGSVGFILNRVSDIIISDVIKNLDIEAILSIGGPVETNSVHYLHTLGDAVPNSVHIIDNVYWGGDFEHIRTMINSGIADTDKFRFFIGYSGWDANQLENEISNNYWIVAGMKGKQIMSENKDTWEKCLEDIGGKYRAWKNVPIDPELN